MRVDWRRGRAIAAAACLVSTVLVGAGVSAAGRGEAAPPLGYRSVLPPPPPHPKAGEVRTPLRFQMTAEPISRTRPGRSKGGGGSGSSTTIVYTPANIQQAYDFGSLASGGAGQTVAVVDAYGDPNLSRDLQTFDAKFGLPSASVSVYDVDGRPGNNSNWAIETALDVEWVHANAPGAKIALVVAANASFQDLLDAVVKAESLHPVAISMSWGAPETDFPAALCVYGGQKTDCLSAYEAAFRNAGSALLLASSGDSGATDGTSSLAVNYPASSQSVVGVGGTTLLLNSAGAYGSETAWSGSGGGYSQLFSLPSYQSSAGITGSGRGVPDVAFDADPNTGVYVYHYPYWYAVGGTSVGSPNWAALATDIAAAYGARLSPATVYGTVYGHAAALHDITSGNNGYYSAGPGWDPVTGVGSPDVLGVAQALAS